VVGLSAPLVELRWALRDRGLAMAQAQFERGWSMTNSACPSDVWLSWTSTVGHQPRHIGADCHHVGAHASVAGPRVQLIPVPEDI